MLKIRPYTDIRGERRTRITAGNNGRIMWDSAEGYVEPGDRDHAIDRLIDDITAGNFEIMGEETGGR